MANTNTPNISIHSLRMEGDSSCFSIYADSGRYFNPLPPHGGRRTQWGIYHCHRHFNPLPPHGGRLHTDHKDGGTNHISIHSLRMEGDRRQYLYQLRYYNFNPLPPHGGRPGQKRHTGTVCHFNPLPPHGGRLPVHRIRAGLCRISIHSLRMEGDQEAAVCLSFLKGISIHSLRMEGDRYWSAHTWILGHFNPLPPHGGRLDDRSLPVWIPLFQSTPSAWRET